MPDRYVNPDALYDAGEARRAGDNPWTFFAYPTACAVAYGLPPDELVWQFVADVQACGIDVGIWNITFDRHETLLACRAEDRDCLNSVVMWLQSEALYGEDFLLQHSLALLNAEAEESPGRRAD